MKRAFRVGMVAMAGLVFGGSVAAKDLSLRCDFAGQKPGEWISPVMFIGHKSGADTAVVSDSLILQVMKSPVKAKVTTDNANRLTVKWVVEGAKDLRKRQVPRFNYSATYQRGTGRVSVYAKPSGYDSRFSALGTCRQIKSK